MVAPIRGDFRATATILAGMVREQDCQTPMATAADIMTTTVVTTTPDADVWTVAHSLLEHGFGGMPVLGEDGELVGMVSGFDVISKSGTTINQIMSRGVVWANPDDSFAAVVQLMGLHGIRRVPVCENGTLIGIISRSDLLRHTVASHDRE
jgi:CBS domain-containing protein